MLNSGQSSHIQNIPLNEMSVLTMQAIEFNVISFTTRGNTVFNEALRGQNETFTI